MSEKIFPVLVAGSGPTGLIAALVLRLNGIDVRIIEKRTEYAIGQRGAGIQPRTLELYHFLGVLPDIRAAGLSSIGKMKFYAPPPNADKVIKEMEPFAPKAATPDTPYPNPILLGQNESEAILRRHLAHHGVTVELGTELKSFEQLDDHVVVTLAKPDNSGQEVPETVRFRWLVGADGARGVVRRQLGFSFIGETLEDVTLITGDVRIHDCPLSRDWHMWRGATEGSVGVTFRPTSADKEIWNFVIAGPPAEKAASLKHEDFVSAVNEVIGRQDLKFGDFVWIGTWKPNIRMVDRFSDRRVFIAGDAAHVHSPTGAQGMNSSVQDAFNLAWKLALVERNLAPISLLSSYSEERLPVIAEMLQITTKVLNHARQGDDAKAWKRGGEFAMLGVNYRGSRITLEERQIDEQRGQVTSSYSASLDGVLRAGDRAPDAPGLVGKDGQETRLFDLFKPTHHTIIIFHDDKSVTETAASYPREITQLIVISSSSHNRDDVETFTDRDGHAATAYNITSEQMTVAIVRPDGFVGAFTHSAEGMKRYFDKILL